MVITKDANRTLNQGLLPGMYLARMNLKPVSQFGSCFFAFQRFQGYFGFE
jgi:hypothetical protein